MEIVPKNCVSVVEFWLDGFVRKIGHKVYLIGEQYYSEILLLV